MLPCLVQVHLAGKLRNSSPRIFLPLHQRCQWISPLAPLAFLLISPYQSLC